MLWCPEHSQEAVLLQSKGSSCFVLSSEEEKVYLQSFQFLFYSSISYRLPKTEHQWAEVILEVLWNTPWGFKCPFSLLYLPEIFFALLIFQKPFCHQLHRFKWHLFGTKSTEHPSNIKKNIFNSFNIRMRINLIFFSFYLTLCSTWWLRESKSKKRHFICTPNFKESTASLQFDTKNFFKKDSLIDHVFPFCFGPRYLELKVMQRKGWMEMAACTTV